MDTPAKGSKIFKGIFKSKIETLKFAFQEGSKDLFYDDKRKKLIHAGEFGKYRENACKDFLRAIVPKKLEFGSGFVITSSDKVSTECDIIIYDKNNTPFIENNEHQRFYPIETIVGIGEIKSDLTKGELKKALNKLAKNKALREKIPAHSLRVNGDIGKDFSPSSDTNDHICSFIICNRFAFDFNNIVNEIDTLYDSDVKPWNKHNFVLSIADGVLLYIDSKDAHFHAIYPYSPTSGARRNRFIAPSEKDGHFYGIATYIFMITSNTAVFYPEMVDYLEPIDPGIVISQ